jgi:signal transduction histidine kinase
MLCFAVALLAVASAASAQQDFLDLIHSFPVIVGKIADAKTNTSARVRVQVTGTVTYEFAPGYFFLHDGTGDIRVHVPGPSEFQRGDLVQVTSVPRIIEGVPWMQSAEAKKIGTGTLPEAREITVIDALKETCDAQYVTLRGQVLGESSYRLRGRTSEALLFEADGILCKALFKQGTGALKLFPKGTIAAFTGICRLGARIEESNLHYVHILVETPEEVRVIENPPIWSESSWRRIFSVIVLLLVCALSWNLWQRRRHILLEKRVKARTAELQAEISARQNVEAELLVALQAEKEINQLKSSFVSMVSHEFRTPLEVILSSSNILDRYLDRLPQEKRAAQLRAIRKSVHRMNDLIDDVLLLGKFDAGVLTCQPSPVDLAAFCRRAAAEIESATNRMGAIQFTVDDIAGDACADEGLLQHILTNILGNAVKYSPPDQSVAFSLKRHGSNADFVVCDRGCGIPALDQARLFTAFYRGSNVGQTSGSGLGLVIAKRCVDLHGGTIRCESQPGAGTTFTVSLPLFDGTRIFHRRPSGEPITTATSITTKL